MTKSAKKSKSTTATTGVFSTEDKGPHAVIVADLYARRFDPLTRTTPHCLLPLAGIPLLHYSLARLLADGFRNVIICACSHAAQVQKFVQSYQENVRKKDTRITVHNSENCRNLGDLMRDLDASQALRGIADFLLIPADLICATALIPFLKQHEARRARNPAAILSLVLPRASKLIAPVQAAEWSVSVLLSPSMDNRIIKLLHTGLNIAPNILLQELLRANPAVELSSNLFDLGVAVCSNHIAPLFQDNFDYQTMADLIHDVLTNEEVMGYSMHVDRVPSGPMFLCAAPDLHTLIELTPYVLMRDLGIQLSLNDSPLLTDRDAWISYGPHIYVARSARVHPSAQLIGSCLIGSGCQIGSGALLIDCVLGAECHIGSGARLRRVVALERVHLDDDVRADTAWICSQASVLRKMVLPSECFIGPSTEDGPRVTLGPGPGNLSSHTVVVAPGPSDIILDPTIGGGQVWAAIYTGKPRVSSEASSDGYSDDSSSEPMTSNVAIGTNQQSRGSCVLWDTAKDRIHSHMARLRRTNARARGQSSTSEPMVSQRRPSVKLTRKSGGTVSNAETDADRLFDSSEDEGEQSEAFLVGELRDTLEHSQGADSAVENVILEVNSLKHAYNIAIEDLYFLLTKAIIELTQTRRSTSVAKSEVDKTQVRTFVAEFKTQLMRFEPVLRSYFGHSSQASRQCLQALEDSACYNSLVMESSPYLMHALYDSDLIAEEAIWWWATNSPLLADEDLSERTKSLRDKLQPFLTWLKEAESEGDDDDDDDDEGEE